MSLGDGGYRGDPGGGPGGHQTRTRLPDEPGAAGTYGGGRRTSRSPRGLVGVVGVVVLLIAAIAFANRGDGGGESSGERGKGGPAARATAPTGERPVKGSEAGVATGFPRTEQGAESAAANYAVALSGDGMFNAETRREIVEAVYSPRVASARLAELDKAYSREKFLAGIGLEPDGSAPEGMTFVARANPVGTKTEKFGNDSATVAVWYSQLFGLAGEGSKNPVTEGWYTNILELQWVDDDWKVTGFEEKDGPAPVGRDQVASSAEEMAEAVEGFGGFTYAR
ncbi:hypothetical protein [Streptomyces albus]|uniref:hypothetical protein n=1 Tax=Streptomyces albus TaxID=1888 RepID=UPI0004CA78B6|nr:hypothetical protein [Streptomyces albus]